MTKSSGRQWPYPGSRWWKFDFHTHTPASADYGKGERQALLREITPKDWLLGFMRADVDCVAVTDHNSGEWIDGLKEALTKLECEQHSEFRPLHLFPGVEITASGSIHILAILDTDKSSSEIDKLLGDAGYRGNPGASDLAAEEAPIGVVKAVCKAGGIPILAHVDGPAGAWRLPGNTLGPLLDSDGLFAMEVVDADSGPPDLYRQRRLAWAEVLGSDSHHPAGEAGDRFPGSHYTWVKMAKPSLEGLRLALLDGNGVSVRRSDEGEFEPFRTPAQFITCIEVETARFMGNGSAEKLELTPFYNALIGGRGTGKSTVVQALRLAYRRDDDLKRLRDDTELRRQFERFTKVVKGRSGNGALREGTEIRVKLTRDGLAHRLRWRQDGQGEVVEEHGTDGQWQASASSMITAERFPIRLLSQGQIAAMAGENRQALLDIIDEAANVVELHRTFEEAERTYFSRRARLRELGGRLEGRPELQRKLDDVIRKLDAFTKSHHADVLRSHQRAARQRREIEGTLAQLREMPERVQSLARELLIDDWPDGTFDIARDADAIEWRSEADRALAEFRQSLAQAAETLVAGIRTLASDSRLGQWRQRADQAQAEYVRLQEALEVQGVADPQAFGRLVQERQQLEAQVKELGQVQQELKQLEADCDSQWQRVSVAREAITHARAEFVKNTLQANAFVRMEVVRFGFDSRVIEHSLRHLLNVSDERFESDILRLEDGEPVSGLALDLARADDRERALSELKQRIMGIDVSFGGHFRNYLRREMEKPEFADHVRCWFPEDDLRIEYNRGGNNWARITEGSQGQRSAALLAFLLAFGDEPLVLDQPEDDLDNHLIYDLIVRQIRENKLRRQLIIVTHNPNVVVNGDAEMVHALDFRSGQCRVVTRGALQESEVREEVCRVMEGGREAFARRWARLGRG